MKKMIKALFTISFVIFIVSDALAADKTSNLGIKTVDKYIAVFDFEVTTGDKGISRPLSDKVIHELSLSDKYEIIDRGNMNKILKEQKFQMTGCVAQECKVEAGQILGVGKIVSGSVGIVGKTYYLTLQLIDVKTGKVELSAEDECRCEIDELLGSTKRLARKLIGEQITQPAAGAEQAAKAKAEAEAKAKTEAEAKAKAEEAERIRIEKAAITKAKAEAEFIARMEAEAKARAEAELKARAELEARTRAEVEARAKAEQSAKAKAEAEEVAREKARAEAIAKAKVEEIERAKAAQIAGAKAESEAKAKAEEAERAKTEQIARERAKAEAEAKAKSEEIERLKAELARARADAELRAKYEETERFKAGQIGKADIKKQESQKLTSSTKTIDSGDRFKKLASGVVRDTKSGLDWYAGPDKNIGWDDAKLWVSGLRVDGGGWRMPTIEELKGLYQRGSGLRNMTSLLETTGWWVWSGDTGGLGMVAGNSGWALDFDNGVETLDRRDNSSYRRSFAVRFTPKTSTAEIDLGAVSAKRVNYDGRFEKLSSGVVRDTKSGLDWYAGPDINIGWDDAKIWVSGLLVDGGGWRMPTMEELKTLYQKGAGSRNMTSLLETTGWLVWSGKTAAISSFDIRASALDLDDGTEFADRPGNSNYKRGFAVRFTPKTTTAEKELEVVSAKRVDYDGRFEKLSSGVVRDTKSGLDWYAGPDKNIGWDDAKLWISGLLVDGGGWRMPTIGELKGLYQKGTGSRNMTSLLETTGWWVWSGDTGGLGMVAGNSGWALDFDNGVETLDRRDNSSFRRSFAVRSRK